MKVNMAHAAQQPRCWVFPSERRELTFTQTPHASVQSSCIPSAWTGPDPVSFRGEG